MVALGLLLAWWILAVCPANLCPEASPEEVAASLKRKQSTFDLGAPPAKKPTVEAAADGKVVDKLTALRVV